MGDLLRIRPSGWPCDTTLGPPPQNFQRFNAHLEPNPSQIPKKNCDVVQTIGYTPPVGGSPPILGYVHLTSVGTTGACVIAVL
mmetsp:Transcript_450/g.659  ORF Transcript_450/g.659 Transcript_450/m.659 type:complete len:83 (+) Transcript_450:253-501(+)